MNLKRSLLAVITAISLLSVVVALAQSLGEPQVQAQLELYQTNLILNVAELEDINSGEEANQNWQKLSTSLIGSAPYQMAEKQYQNTLNLTEQSLADLEKQNQELINNNNTETPRQLLKQNIEQNQVLVDDLKLKLGIIYAYQNQLDVANKYWEQVQDEDSRQVVQKIWNQKQIIDSNLEETIKNQYEYWFEVVNLAQLYQVTDQPNKLEQVNLRQQEYAKKALYKLLSLSLIPVLGGVIGFSLLIFLLFQLLWKKSESILALNADKSWNPPWDGETIWQVLVVGFFFLSQLALPILISFSGFNSSALDIRGKVLYVLVTYLLMAGGGLTVLYLSIKQFLPLPENWFKLRQKNWYLWGIGGYLCAIPLVFFISVINQQIWEGRGGSNPLLLLTLESQDKFALFILFLTASVAAPIFEETMFRGFLLPSLTRYMSVTSAIVISGLIFAIAHLSLAEVIPLTVLGIILGIVYTRSRSLLASIMVHSLWNSGTLFTLFILGSGLD